MTKIEKTDLARDALYEKVNTMYDECVHTTGEEYIDGRKHFTDAVFVEDTTKFLGSGLANNGSIVLQSSKTDGGFIQFLVQNYPEDESRLYNNGHLCIDKAPSETTTTSTQIDTVGARNTALNNKIQKVSTLPATQVTGVLYVIPE